MTTNTNSSLPSHTHVHSNRQRLFVRYFIAILIDLVVLNLFVEFSPNVVIDSFYISLLTALLLQFLLKVTINIEHRVAAYFSAKPGGLAKFLRYFVAWLILFTSKFVILEAISFAFEDEVHFGGPLHGLVILIVVIVTMLAAEEAFNRFYRWLE